MFLCVSYFTEATEYSYTELCLYGSYAHCSHGHGPYSGASAGATWRVSFAILIPVVLYVLYYRIYVLQELKVLATVKKRDGVKGGNDSPAASE